MILIADSGSSKTDWRLIDEEGHIHQAKTSGINPFLHTEEEVSAILQSELLPQLPQKQVKEAHFYGAGCASEKSCTLITHALEKIFPGVKTSVTHDMMAAARALCNKEAGIACIIGTGSNSCLYDGEKIVDKIPALGYVLGDEGSGSYMGRQLLNAYLKRDMPSDLAEKFFRRFEVNLPTVLENVYRQPSPSRYIAGFSRFAFHHLKHPYIFRMVYKSFEDFFDKNVCKYDNYTAHPIHFTGSVAFYYSNVLRQVANDQGLFVKNIVEAPIAGLTLYHQERM
jgi:N-acetylglucosamine kinase-like BadF-type ATPase